MPTITLPGPQSLKLRDALFAAFPNPDDFNEALIAVNRTLAGVAREGTLPMRILEAIKHAETNNWLMELLDVVVMLHPADTTLANFRAQLELKGPPQGISPFDFCRLGGGTVMVDRAPLRDAVEELCDPNGRRILVIRGEPQCGKSHSLQLVTFISTFVGGFTPVAINLEPRRQEAAPLVIDARELASRLVKLLRYSLTVPPPTDRQWAKWAVDFCDDFEALARREPPTWIVIDGLNKVVLDQPAHELLHELANRIYTTLSNIRLVLVGYEESLPAGVLPYIQEERVARITNEHLIEFFARAYIEMKIPHTEDSLADVMERVLNAVDLTAPDYLVKLGPTVAQELSRLVAAKAGA